jgi:hypothetical protein
MRDGSYVYMYPLKDILIKFEEKEYINVDMTWVSTYKVHIEILVSRKHWYF